MEPFAKRQKRTWHFPDEVWHRIQEYIPHDRNCSSPVAAIFKEATHRRAYGYEAPCPIPLWRICDVCGDRVLVHFDAHRDGELVLYPCDYFSEAFWEFFGDTRPRFTAVQGDLRLVTLTNRVWRLIDRLHVRFAREAGVGI